MAGIDLALFDYDRHNALYFFIMNADERIYLRYGGRDSSSADSYLNMRSLELALQQGLELHRDGVPEPAEPPPAPLFAKDIPLLYDRTTKRGQCVECHLIADFQAQQREIDGTLDPLETLFASPDLHTIGVFLDVPKGLLVAESKGVAAEAGLKAGDTVTHLEGTRVRTFGDLQHRYGKVPKDAKSIELRVSREGQEQAIAIQLPPRWWLTDTEYRHWSIDPLVDFRTDPLPDDEKKTLGLPDRSFASRVTQVDPFSERAKPPLQVGDIVVGVDDAREDPDANTAELYIQLHCRAGDETTLQILRGGQPMTSRVLTERQYFRK